MEGLWYSYVLRDVMMEKRLAERWKLIYRYDVSEVLLLRLNQGSHASPTFFPGKVSISKYLWRFDIIYSTVQKFGIIIGLIILFNKDALSDSKDA